VHVKTTQYQLLISSALKSAQSGSLKKSEPGERISGVGRLKDTGYVEGEIVMASPYRLSPLMHGKIVVGDIGAEREIALFSLCTI
jgi:hypothetical protein